MDRILYINGGIMARGGIESFMMNYYRNFDRGKIQIDFVVHGFDAGYYDDEIKKLGGRIYNVPLKSKDYRGNIKALSEIYSSNKYRIVHSHMDAMNYVPLNLAKKNGIPYRISHSHNTNYLTNNFFKIILNKYAQILLKNVATHYFACSEDAGKWLYGTKLFNNGNIKIIRNAINLDIYKYNLSDRETLRKQLNVEDSFVVGHIGRFDYQKNHIFLLKIFKELTDRRKDSKLILIGEGHLMESIKEGASKLDISDNIIFMGSRPDVNKFLNVFDCFLFPSHFEGLPFVLIEVQANGLKIFSSDKVPSEVNITNNVYFESLSSKPEEWVDMILSMDMERSVSSVSLLEESGYNIKTEAKKLQEYYMDLLS